MHAAFRQNVAPPRARARRVALLVTGIAIFNVVDLLFTLTHLRTTGMHEANPLARLVIQNGGAAALVAFKLGAMGLGAGLLLRLRRHPAAERCAWLLFAVLAALALHWRAYDAEMRRLAPYIQADALVARGVWVRLPQPM